MSGNRLLSLAHLTVADADPPELVRIAAEAGFGAVGLRLVPPMPDPDFRPVAGALLDDTLATLRTTGISVLDVEAVWLRPDTEVPTLLPVLETAARLGARHVLAVGHDPDPVRLADRFAAFCAATAPFGLRVMLEFIPYCAVGTPAEALRLIGTAGPGQAGLLVDALHLQRSGGSPADIAALDPALLDYAQICDAPLQGPAPDQRRAEAIGRRLYPGEGELPLAELLAALPPNAPLSVEAPNARTASLPRQDRARLAAEATRRLLG